MKHLVRIVHNLDASQQRSAYITNLSKQMMLTFDENGDGKLDFEEFKVWACCLVLVVLVVLVVFLGSWFLVRGPCIVVVLLLRWSRRMRLLDAGTRAPEPSLVVPGVRPADQHAESYHGSCVVQAVDATKSAATFQTS